MGSSGAPRSGRGAAAPGAGARRPGPLLVAAVLTLVLAGLLAAIVSGGDDGGDDGAAATCRSLQGTLRAGDDGDPVCETRRSAYAVETVRLRPGGGVVAADAAARRAACARDARTARARARARVRAGRPADYATYRWTAPGACRSSRATLPAGEVRALRAAPLLAAARDALEAGDPVAALRDARRADDLAGSDRTRALIARAARARAAEAADRDRAARRLVSPNEYLGLSCAAIGHAFRVALGSDPAHDPDGDGEACEAE